MRSTTYDFWSIKNEHIKNVVFFLAVLLITVIAVLGSSISVGLVNTLRLWISNPEIENLRDTAINMINTFLLWNLVNEFVRGIFIVLLIKWINKHFNKTGITLKELGISFDIKQLFYIVIGIVLMTSMFLGASIMDGNSGSWSVNMNVTFSQEGIFLLILIAFANAFWQEVLFRGFFQKRMIHSYGVIAGVILCAFIFTILHGLARDINLLEIILGSILFTIVGLLFHFTQSLGLAIAMHATGNFFLRSFGTNELVIPSQEFRMIIFGMVLIIICIFFRKRL